MAEGPISVLLVEDDEDDYLLTKDLFSELPIDVYCLHRVDNFDAAVATFRQSNSYDLYLVDYRLGNRTGIELLAEADRCDFRAPMIMLTGQREREVDLQAMKAGAVDFLVKDELNAAALERAMRYALKQKRYEETIRRINQDLERRVSERTAELARVNETLQNEISQRRNAEEELVQASRRKDEFIATLAHELRNPLAPLSAALQLMELDPSNLKDLQEWRTIMMRQVRHLVRLIDDLLDVSRISRGKLSLRRDVMLLQDAVIDAVDAARPLLTEANHQFVVKQPDQPLKLLGDKVRIVQMISNLLINAAKYTPSGGRIELIVERNDHQALIQVRDTGIGIPTKMLGKIFDLFTQVEGSKEFSPGGLGIGLTLVKTLAQMHGGSIQARSEGPGKGSEFTVRLPLAPIVHEVEEHEPGNGEFAQGPLPVHRVLVVDDNVPAAKLLSRLLEKLGQHVHTVHSAVAALENIPFLKPDIVISDIAMPGMSGYDLAQRIRAFDDLHAPLLIALTGFGQESDRQHALAAGFDDHLTKPADLQTLEVLLRTVRRGSGS